MQHPNNYRAVSVEINQERNQMIRGHLYAENDRLHRSVMADSRVDMAHYSTPNGDRVMMLLSSSRARMPRCRHIACDAK